MDSQDQSESWVKNAQLDSYTFNPELNTGQFVILIDYYYADQFLNSQINGMAFVATLEISNRTRTNDASKLTVMQLGRI